MAIFKILFIFILVIPNRPDEFDSWGWHNILQVKINNDIQKFFESFPKSDEPAIISQSRIMYKSCITAGKGLLHYYS